MHACISIEIHATCFILVPVNAIGYVDASLPKKKAMEEVTDELSTRPGLEVTVHKSGKLRIKKKPDPNWDASRDECLSEASDDEEEEDSDDESAKKKPVAKKEKKEAKKRPNKETTAEAERNGKKKKQKKAKVEADDKDSEDEEMDRAEQKYLKRQAEEEEADPKDKVEKKSKKDEEIEDDDDVEGSSGEESESFDDDQVNPYRNSYNLVEGKLYLKGIFNGYMIFNRLFKLYCDIIIYSSPVNRPPRYPPKWTIIGVKMTR